MRLPLILAACLAATSSVAQAPRIKWRQMDFPVTTKVEVTTPGGQAVLGDIRPFYLWAKTSKWSCTFDNADLSSGLQTLQCHGPFHKEAFVWDVEYLPEKGTLRFDEATIPNSGHVDKETVGMTLSAVCELNRR